MSEPDFPLTMLSILWEKFVNFKSKYVIYDETQKQPWAIYLSTAVVGSLTKHRWYALIWRFFLSTLRDPTLWFDNFFLSLPRLLQQVAIACCTNHINYKYKQLFFRQIVECIFFLRCSHHGLTIYQSYNPNFQPDCFWKW